MHKNAFESKAAAGREQKSAYGVLAKETAEHLRMVPALVHAASCRSTRSPTAGTMAAYAFHGSCSLAYIDGHMPRTHAW